MRVPPLVNTQIHDIRTEYHVLGTLYHCHQEADLCFRVMNLAAHWTVSAS